MSLRDDTRRAAESIASTAEDLEHQVQQVKEMVKDEARQRNAVVRRIQVTDQLISDQFAALNRRLDKLFLKLRVSED